MFKRKPNRWKSYVLGMAGGLAGTAAMDGYLAAMSRVKRKNRNRPEEQSNAEPHPHQMMSLVGKQHHEDESATAALGRLLYHAVTKRDPGAETKQTLSQIVHWGYGMDMGGVYGLVRAGHDRLDPLGGLLFGASLWVLGDEIGVPVLGLAKAPTEYPVSLHAETLGAHLVYGVATAAATKLLEKAF